MTDSLMLMRNWCGTDSGTPSDNWPFEVIPKHSLCKRCKLLRADWYPKPPPTVRLNLVVESPDAGFHALPVIHEAVFEILRSFWPGALVTRCSSRPDGYRRRSGEIVPRPSEALPIGERYLSVGLPRKFYVYERYPLGVPWSCARCGAWKYSPMSLFGRVSERQHSENRGYVYLRADQTDLEVFMDDLHHILVRSRIHAQIAAKINALGLSEIGWEEFPIRPEPLGYHRIPEDGLGPADPSPFPPPPKFPNAPRVPKKKRGGAM